MKKNIFKIGFTLIMLLVLIYTIVPTSIFAQPSVDDYCLTYPGSCNNGTGSTTATCTGSNALGNLICKVQKTLNSIIPILITLGIVYFIWGVVQYVIAGGDEAKKKGRDQIIYGLIGLAVIVGIWGLVNIVVSTFGLNQNITITTFNSLTPNATQTGPSSCNGTGIGNLICKFQEILNSVIPLLIALGVVYFVWGVVQYVIAGGDEAKKKGRDQIIYGLIGLAVIVGIWGLVNIVVSTFGLGQNANVPSLTPLTTQATTSCSASLATNPKFQDVLHYLTCIINDSVIPFIFALAVVMFIWGVVQFVINSSEEAKKEKGRQFMLWGIIALAVMLSVWGLVNILRATFNLGTGSVLPQVHPP